MTTLPRRSAPRRRVSTSSSDPVLSDRIQALRLGPSRIARFSHMVNSHINANMYFVIVDADYLHVPAHKQVISTASYALGRIIYGINMLPGLVNETLIVDRMSKEGFNQMLWWMYTGKAMLGADIVLEIMEKAHYYGLTGLWHECREMIIEHHITHRDRCLNVYARLYGQEPYDDLIQHCLRVIRFDPQAVAFDQENLWIHLSPAAMRRIIASDRINADEVELFEALMRWARWRNGPPPPVTSKRPVAKAIRLGQKVLVATENIHRYIRWTCMTTAQIRTCASIVPHFFRPQEINAMIAAFDPLARRRQRLTAAGCHWLETSTRIDLHPAAVHAITLYHALPPQYVATMSCGPHKHIFGYPQTGPMPNDTLHRFQLLVGSGYEWRPVGPKGDIPANAVAAPGRYANGDYRRYPLYVGRVYGKYVGLIDWFEHVCRKEVSHVDGKRHHKSASKKFQVLVACDNHPPSNLFEITEPALELVHGGPYSQSCVYLGRAYCMKHIVPVRINMMNYRAYSTHSNRLYVTTCYDMLRIDRRHIAWRQSSQGQYVPNAVLGGRSYHGEKLYIGRTLPDRTGYWEMGKIVPRYRSLFVMWGGEERQHFVYEILVFRRRLMAQQFERRVWGEWADTSERFV